MLRKECASNEGSHEEISEIGSESSEHAPGLTTRSPQLTIIPVGVGADGGIPESGNTSSSSTTATTTHGTNRSDDPPVTSELDPHICKQWPCPHCHKPRDADDEIPEPGQYSSAEATDRPTATRQSFLHPHEPLKLEQSESDDDLLLDIVATSTAHGQNHKGHCSKP